MMETCPNVAPPRPPMEDRQLPRLAAQANQLPIWGAYLSYLSFLSLKIRAAPAVKESVIISLHDDELTERHHGYQRKSSPALDAAQKPYHLVSRDSHVGAVLPRRSCLALHRCS